MNDLGICFCVCAFFFFVLFFFFWGGVGGWRFKSRAYRALALANVEGVKVHKVGKM